MKTGLIIGSYDMPSAVLLNMRAARHFCGDVPVAIADDGSPRVAELAELARREGADLLPNAVRLGHAQGAMSALWKGLLWASSRGLDYVAFLGQRNIPLFPKWLQACSETIRSYELKGEARCLMADVAYDAAYVYTPLDALVFDARYWVTGPRLELVRPVRLGGRAVEEYFYKRCEAAGVLSAPFGSVMPPESWLTYKSQCLADFMNLAHRLGVKLGRDFSMGYFREKPGYDPG